MPSPSFDRTGLDARGVSQVRIRTEAAGIGLEAIANARLDIPSGQWKASVILSPPPSPQGGWGEETFDALRALIPMAIDYARSLARRRSQGTPRGAPAPRDGQATP